MTSPRWKRIVFKPSGEALAGPSGYGLDADTLDATAQEIIAVREMGVDVVVVVGGGNFWRGRQGAMSGMDATQSDHIGMLGTVEDEIVGCFRNGGGVPYERFLRFHEVMAEDSGQSVASALESARAASRPGTDGAARAVATRSQPGQGLRDRPSAAYLAVTS
jgi:hypothetical protein